MREESYEGKRVTVMGLGRFGGGVGVSRFLAARGADVLVTDTLDAEALRDSVAQLAGLPGVTFRLGGHNVSDFTTRDLVVVNPAVPPDNRFVRAAKAAGIPITSEIRLLVRHLPDRMRTIGVTGSAGKSTTTAMIGHALRKLLGQQDQTPGRQDAKTPRSEPGVWIGGNLGGSLLPHLEEIGPEDWVVLELSSFMLEGLREDRWSPHIAVVTNITPNHLDWHGSMEAYIAAKEAIFDFQDGGDVAIREPMRRRFALTLPGEHNQANAGFAAAACAAAGFEIGDELAYFPGLPHRLEFVGEVGIGVRCYNDSKSTTPEAARLAIEAFPEGASRMLRIILGGYDKGSDFAALATLAAERCAGVYTIGATGETIAGLVEAAGRPVQRCGTLEVAVERSLGEARGGDVLVLSPGCASWDQFVNYEQRGARFVELVRAARDKKAGG